MTVTDLLSSPLLVKCAGVRDGLSHLLYICVEEVEIEFLFSNNKVDVDVSAKWGP